jgi:tetraacyldisaccharide 4'-kinase
MEGEISSKIEANCYINLATNEKKDLDFFKSKKCFAIAGIGNPDNFYSLLEELGVNLITKTFADHHKFIEKDFEFKGDYPILMTAKDCVKCKQFATSQMWYLSVDAKISSDFYQQLESKL